MKTRTFFKMVFFVCIVLIATASIVAAGGNKSKFNGERIAFLGPPLFFGAQWSSGPNDIMMNVSSRVAQFYVDTDGDDGRVAGILTTIVNVSFENTEPYKTGREWGTFVIEPDAYIGSYWTGHYIGKATADGNWHENYIGIGTGELDGLKFRAYMENTDLSDSGPIIPARTWSIDGFIIE